MKNVTFLLLYLFAISIFFLHFIIVGTAVYGDGIYYYSYLPSFFSHHTFHSIPWPNPYSIGPALFWTIPYVLFHNQIFIGIWNISFVFLGLFLLYKTLVNFFPAKTSFITIVALFLATNLLFYGAVDVINSHSASFFFSCLFLFLWLKKRSFLNSFFLGISLGLLTLIRTQDIVFIFLPLSTYITTPRNNVTIKQWSNIVLFFFGTLIPLIPQFFLWRLQYGNLLKSPYLYDPHHTFYFFHPHILGVLFNVTDGFFLWTPIAILALIGLYYFIKKHATVGIPMLIVVMAELFIIASWSIWWEGASYSARMMLSSLPLFAFGLASVFQKEGIKKALYLTSIFTGANILLIFVFLLKH